MTFKKRNLKLIIRLIFWITYFFSGYILYFDIGNLPLIFINFSKIIYPITIFWLQVRINNQENWLPITSTMTTSQLWFNILPVLSSILAFSFTLLNLLMFLKNNLT